MVSIPIIQGRCKPCAAITGLQLFDSCDLHQWWFSPSGQWDNWCLFGPDKESYIVEDIRLLSAPVSIKASIVLPRSDVLGVGRLLEVPRRSSRCPG
jgi:hypothetical protein